MLDVPWGGSSDTRLYLHLREELCGLKPLYIWSFKDGLRAWSYGVGSYWYPHDKAQGVLGV